MSKTCIITITQGDFDFIEEWIEYHHNIGVDLFLIGYNGDTDRFKELPQYDYVKYYDFSVNDNSINKSLLSATYNDNFVYIQQRLFDILLNILHTMFTNIIDYTAAIDTDEFLTIKDSTCSNISEFFDKYFIKSEVAMQIDMGMYGDNEIIYKDSRPCLEKYTTLKYHHNHGADWVKWYRKSVFRNKDNRFKTLKMNTAHMCNYSTNHIKFDFDKLELKHLFTKSLEEWIIKFSTYYCKMNTHYKNRFKHNMFKTFWDNNEMTEEKIKAIPELLKKYNIDYNPVLQEDDENFKQLYIKIHNNENS